MTPSTQRSSIAWASRFQHGNARGESFIHDHPPFVCQCRKDEDAAVKVGVGELVVRNRRGKDVHVNVRGHRKLLDLRLLGSFPDEVKLDLAIRMFFGPIAEHIQKGNQSLASTNWPRYSKCSLRGPEGGALLKTMRLGRVGTPGDPPRSSPKDCTYRRRCCR